MPHTRPPHLLLLTWLLFVSTVAFGLYLAHDQGLIMGLFTYDQSKLSVAVALVFLLGCVHCAARIVALSNQVEMATHAFGGIGSGDDLEFGDQSFTLAGGRRLPPGPVGEYLRDVYLHTRNTGHWEEAETDTGDLVDILAANLKRTHEYGWYAVDILIKLGLLGTIVGFILMLGSIADTSSLDVTAMQKVLTQMSSGMGTALYTTLAGLTASILLGAQYLMADKGADALMERALRFAHLTLVPAVRARFREPLDTARP